MDENASSLGDRLRALQLARGLASDEEGARLVDVSYRQYQRWISGESDPRGSSLKKIADAFDIPIAELIGEPSERQLDRIEKELSRQGELLDALAAELKTRRRAG